MFELEIFSKSALLPALVAGAFGFFLSREKMGLPQWLRSSANGWGWWLGMLVTQFAICRWEWWADEPWQRLIWPLLLVQSLTWFPRISAAAYPSLIILSLWAVMPRGENWKDMWGEHNHWMFWGFLSATATLWSMQDLRRRGGEAWYLWIVIGSMGSVLVLAACAYATMAQWVLGALTVSIVAAIFSARKVKTEESILVMLSIVIPALLSWTRFRGVPKPLWIYGVVMFAPTAIVLIDRLTSKKFSTGGRVLQAGILSGFCLGSVIFESLGSSAAEQW